MANYINNITVNKIHHLKDFNIAIEDINAPHLLITGKNGSGKTILLNAIADYLQFFNEDKNLSHLKNKENLEEWNKALSQAESEEKKLECRQAVKFYKDFCDRMFITVDINFSDVYEISKAYHDKDFIFAFYAASRNPQMKEPKNPEKPNLHSSRRLKDGLTSEFLKFMIDLKIQEALARNESQITEADDIRMWFNEFEKILGDIYDDKNLKIEFNYKDYSFRVNTNGKLFKFTELSDGFAAIIDIISDMILKMQHENSLVRAYKKKGVVMIDEIETHLHLALQKNIMPILTTIFPNIQFIVTTHSPFVLSSLPNAIAFDLEKKESINELTEYSYEALAEGYFGVKSKSSYIAMQFDELKSLLSRSDLSVAEKLQAKSIISDFENIPHAISPDIKGAFDDLIISNISKVRML
jgi:predicted ATP-binding protein involved in virulence